MDFETIKCKLTAKGYAVSCFKTAKEASAYLNESLDGMTIGLGGSVTLNQLGILPMLKTHNTVYWHHDQEMVKELGHEGVTKMAAVTDVYLTSANAMTEDGVLINIDGAGNRISSTAFGHKKVIFIMGKNKIEPDTEKAIWRARNIASPKNAKRLGVATPCADKGDKCYDCNSPQRICRGMMIIDRPMMTAQMEIVLIDEDLGY